MRIIYLQANQAYAVTTTGEDIVSLWDESGSLGSIFNTFEELDWALRMAGLERAHDAPLKGVRVVVSTTSY